MSGETSTIDKMVEQKYQHGFVTDIDVDEAPPGLSEDIVRFISQKKKEKGVDNTGHFGYICKCAV